MSQTCLLIIYIYILLVNIQKEEETCLRYNTLNGQPLYPTIHTLYITLNQLGICHLSLYMTICLPFVYLVAGITLRYLPGAALRIWETF